MHLNVLDIDPHMALKDLLIARMQELSKVTLKYPCNQSWAVCNLALAYPCQ